MSSVSAKKSGAKEANQPMEAVMNVGRESIESFVKAGADTASKQYEQAIAMTQEQVEKTSSTLFQNYNEMTAMNQANFEAFMAASNSFAKGFETISKELMAYTQNNMEQSLAASKKLLGAKTAQEFVDLQSDFTRTQLDQALAGSAKLTELTVQFANEAFQPLQARMQQSAEKILKQAA
ncbi:MAG TPA: phasin family protein [Kiloniellales bacterium]|nr:phasin family protein [Kiloniellales bacterium]